MLKINFNLGIMQLAILAPYSNLATSVAAALVPTLLGSKLKGMEENESANVNKITEETSNGKTIVKIISYKWYVTEEEKRNSMYFNKILLYRIASRNYYENV